MGLSNSRVASSDQDDLIERVPQELQDRCLEFAATIDRQTCLAVCLTSKYGRKVATRILYRNIYLSGPRDDEDFHNKIEDRMRRMSLLCRTLSENRALARQVREMDVYLDPLNGVSIQLPPPLDTNCLRMMVEADLGLTSAQQEKFWEWLGNQFTTGMPSDPEESDEDMEDDEDQEEHAMLGPETYLGILIVACPQLQHLKVEGDYNRLSSVAELNEVLRIGSNQASSTPTIFADGLANLPEVYFANSGDNREGDHPMTVEQLLPVLTWTHRKIKIRNLGQDMSEFFRPTHLDDEILSRLQDLQVESAQIEDWEITALLRACPKLKSCSFAWGQGCDFYRGFDWRGLGDALPSLMPLLEELRLDVPHKAGLRDSLIPDTARWAEMDEAERDRVSVVNTIGLGDLTGLERLRRLAAPKIALFGSFDDESRRDRDWTLADILPPLIEEVEIFCEGVDLTEDDRELLTGPGTVGLKDITIFNCTRHKWISTKRGEGSMEEV